MSISIRLFPTPVWDLHHAFRTRVQDSCPHLSQSSWCRPSAGLVVANLTPLNRQTKKEAVIPKLEQNGVKIIKCIICRNRLLLVSSLVAPEKFFSLVPCSLTPCTISQGYPQGAICNTTPAPRKVAEKKLCPESEFAMYMLRDHCQQRTSVPMMCLSLMLPYSSQKCVSFLLPTWCQLYVLNHMLLRKQPFLLGIWGLCARPPTRVTSFSPPWQFLDFGGMHFAEKRWQKWLLSIAN